MLKMTLTGAQGEKHYVLGITQENITRLLDNQPIRVDLGELGGPQGETVFLFAAATEADLIEDLRSVGVLPKDFKVPPRGQRYSSGS